MSEAGLRLACYQCPSPAGDLAAAYDAVDTALSGAAEAGVAMLVMPECFLPGYNSLDSAPEFEEEAALEALTVLVRRHKVGLTIGMVETTQGRTFNTAVALSSDGIELARYRKVQLHNDSETKVFSAGERLCAFDYLGHRFGLLICHDVEFPEHVRALARAGVQSILVPSASVQPWSSASHMLVPARAAENAVCIAYANYCDTEGALRFVGCSQIAGPDGAPLARTGQEARLIVADVETAADQLQQEGVSLLTQLRDYRCPAGLEVNGDLI